MANIMVVDDAIFMRASIKQVLEEKGHAVVAQAESGTEAIEKYLDVKPDVVLLDITMPGMNGVEALKRLKVLDANAKIIICSAVGQQEKIAEAIEAGALDFIVKPFKPERLTAAVEHALKQK